MGRSRWDRPTQIMVHVLLLAQFDLLAVAQLGLHCQREKVEMRTVGLVNRPIPANISLHVQTHTTADQLHEEITTLFIPDCSATTQLLIEPRIHRLVQRADAVYAMPSVTATLARIGLLGVQTVRTVQEISIEEREETVTIVNVSKKEVL